MAYGNFFPSLYDDDRAPSDYQILMRQYWGLGLLASHFIPWSNAFKARQAYSEILANRNIETRLFNRLVHLIFKNVSYKYFLKFTNAECSKAEDPFDTNIFGDIFDSFPLIALYIDLFEKNVITTKSILKALNPFRLINHAITFVQAILKSILLLLTAACIWLIESVEDSTKPLKQFISAALYIVLGIMFAVYHLTNTLAFNLPKAILNIAKNIIDAPLSLISNLFEMIIDKIINLGKTLVVVPNVNLERADNDSTNAYAKMKELTQHPISLLPCCSEAHPSSDSDRRKYYNAKFSIFRTDASTARIIEEKAYSEDSGSLACKLPR